MFEVSHERRAETADVNPKTGGRAAVRARNLRGDVRADFSRVPISAETSAPAAAAVDPGPAPEQDPVGKPLDAQVRTKMEAGFGYDFSQVRVHDSARASDLATSMNARAFTDGSDIVFARDAFAPDTREGFHLVAHELAHVVQQGGRSPAGSNADRSGEHSAHLAADVVAAGGRATVSPRSVSGPQCSDGRSGSGAPKVPALTPVELWQLVQSKRGFESTPSGPGDTHRAQAATLPPGSLHLDEAGNPTAKGAPLGKGYETFAAVQLVDASGNLVTIAADHFAGNGPDDHAEARCVHTLETAAPARLEGGKLVVVSDQTVCPSCRQRLIEFAKSRGLTVVEPHLPIRPKMIGTGDASAKTTSRSSTQAGRPPLEVVPQEPIRIAPPTSPGSGGRLPLGPATPPPAAPPKAAPESVSVPEPVTGPRLKAEVGEPLSAPFEGTPGFNGNMKGAVEGGALMLHQGLVSIIERNQQELAEAALKAKQPEINQLRRRGLWVIASVVMDQPRSVDLLRGVFTEPSQIAMFRYITLRYGDTRAEAENPPMRFEAAKPNVTYRPIEKLPESRKLVSYDVMLYAPIEPEKPVEQGWPGGVPVQNADIARRFIRALASLRDKRLGPPNPPGVKEIGDAFIPYDTSKPQVQDDLAILVTMLRLTSDERQLMAQALGPGVLRTPEQVKADQGRRK